MLFGDVAACLQTMLPHHQITQRRNFTECFNINITLARFSTSSLMMFVDRNM